MSRDWWTTEADDQLRDMWEVQGLSSRQIALEMSCNFERPYTRNAIIGRARRMGLANRRPTGPNGGRQSAETHKAHKHVMYRTTSSKQFAWDTSGPPPENPHELLGPPVSLMVLEKHHCRGPITGENGETFYCGAQRADGYSYCRTHCRMYYCAPRITDVERARRAMEQRKRLQAQVLRRAAA